MEILALVWIVLLVLFAWRLAGNKKNVETIDRGRELLMAGMPDRALRVFERLAEQPHRDAPGRERAIYWLARTHEELGDQARAKQLYKQYMAEYVNAPNAKADAEVRQLVMHRLSRLRGPASEERPVERPGREAPAHAHPQSDWARYKAERDALLVKVREKHDVPQITVEPHVTARLITPPEAEPVSLDKIAKDLNAIAAGRRMGEYVLAEKLGEGGFGEVYRALRPVAIKLARDPSVVEHLRRFGTIQSQVKSDRVVKPLEVNLEADPPYVVMELVDGCTLRDLLETKEVKDVDALTILREVALGLRDAHEGGILHLDMKPENVLIDETGKVKITDFELGNMSEEAAQSKLSRSLATVDSEGKIAGTIAYMSPEQRDGKVPDARSDVYTFGIMLFEALTAQRPQPGDKISDFRKDIAHVSELDRIFEKCFTRHERRYATIGELAKDMEWICDRLPKADLAALMRSAPMARARVADRATETDSEVVKREKASPEKASPEKASPERSGADKSSSDIRIREKEPREAEPSAAEKAAADALIARRAAAAREAEALIAPPAKVEERRPPIAVEPARSEPARVEPARLEPPAAVRPPLVVETAPPPAPVVEGTPKRAADKPQLEPS